MIMHLLLAFKYINVDRRVCYQHLRYDTTVSDKMQVYIYKTPLQ